MILLQSHEIWNSYIEFQVNWLEVNKWDVCVFFHYNWFTYLFSTLEGIEWMKKGSHTSLDTKSLI